MPKQKRRSPLVRRDSRGVISEINATGLALMMRENAQALFLNLEGTRRAFNPDIPRKRCGRRPGPSSFL